MEELPEAAPESRMLSDEKPATGSRASALLRSVVMDVQPLRVSPGFRWLYGSQLSSHLSRHILVVAVPYQIYVLTGKTWLVGMVGVAQLVPLMTGSLFGGAAADAIDRRRLLMILQILLIASAAGFIANTALGGMVWPIFALIAVNAGLFGIDAPTRISMVPALVPRNLLASAFALNQVLIQTSQVVGPTVAGLLIARFGVSAAYGAAAACAVVTAATLTRLPHAPRADDRPGITVASVLEGWRYLRTKPLLQQTLAVDLSVMVLGVPRALFPAIGTTVLGGDAATVGLLYAAPGAGALTGALTTGWVSRVRRQGRAVVLAAGVWGCAIAGFGLARSVPAALALLALAGAADVISAVFRSTILQLAVPEVLRGRLSAIHVTAVTGGPQLGDARAGAVAAATSPTTTAVAGGIASVAGVAVVAAWAGHALWKQSSDDGKIPPLP